MSTLAEIESAAERLSLSERAKLLAFLEKSLSEAVGERACTEDPFEQVIGAFAGHKEATGRHAEQILYGSADE